MYKLRDVVNYKGEVYRITDICNRTRAYVLEAIDSRWNNLTVPYDDPRLQMHIEFPSSESLIGAKVKYDLYTGTVYRERIVDNTHKVHIKFDNGWMESRCVNRQNVTVTHKPNIPSNKEEKYVNNSSVKSPLGDKKVLGSVVSEMTLSSLAVLTEKLDRATRLLAGDVFTRAEVFELTPGLTEDDLANGLNLVKEELKFRRDKGRLEKIAKLERESEELRSREERKAAVDAELAALKAG